MTTEANGFAAFFQENAEQQACFDALRKALMERYPETVILIQKSQISFRDQRPYCYVWSPEFRKVKGGGIVVTFGLDAPVPDPRISGVTEPYPNRWTHHVEVHDPEEVDGQLLAWIDWAYRLKQKKKS